MTNTWSSTFNVGNGFRWSVDIWTPQACPSTRHGFRWRSIRPATMEHPWFVREDLAANAVRWADITPSESVELDERAFAQVRESGSCVPYEREFVHKDGSRVPVLIGLSGLEGVSNRAIAFTVDISARRAAQAETRSREEFLGVLSHEMRTPTNAILGWAHMLRSGSLPPQAAARGLEAIQRNAALQARIIEDLLDVSRAINHKIELRTTRVDVRSMLEMALDTIRPVARSRTLTLTQSPSDEPLFITADPARIQQVMLNLLNNAVKFTEENGHIDVRCRRDGSRIEIAVIDDGIGIEPALLPHVFERFKQGARLERPSSGLGLGLAISENLVRLHNGTIDALSDGPNLGATILIRLPAA